MTLGVTESREMSDEEFGTVDDYTRAFEELRRRAMIRENHIALLQAHFDAPNHTITWANLARMVRYEHASTVHLEYGRLASLVARQLGKQSPPKGFWLSVLADWAKARDSTGKTAFVLRRPVIEALARLGMLQVLPVPSTLKRLEVEFQLKIGEAQSLPRELRRARLAESPRYPKRLEVVVTIFDRSPYVTAEVLARAAGRCEACHAPAPFLRSSDGTPYLEVHHVRPLAKGGEDTVENAAALCPNCHRRSHYG